MYKSLEKSTAKMTTTFGDLPDNHAFIGGDDDILYVKIAPILTDGGKANAVNLKYSTLEFIADEFWVDAITIEKIIYS